jgi:hypothetical protein
MYLLNSNEKSEGSHIKVLLNAVDGSTSKLCFDLSLPLLFLLMLQHLKFELPHQLPLLGTQKRFKLMELHLPVFTDPSASFNVREVMVTQIVSPREWPNAARNLAFPWPHVAVDCSLVAAKVLRSCKLDQTG